MCRWEVSGEQNERFTVRRGGSMLVLGPILLVAFGGAAIWQVVNTGLAESRNILFAGVFCVLAGIAVILDYKKSQAGGLRRGAALHRHVWPDREFPGR